MPDFRISQSETLKLINLYKQKEQLWNYRSHLYKRVDLKKKAWAEIAKQFKKDIIDVKTKLKSLRSAYVSEKKKVIDSIRSGDEVHEPHLFYFNAFSFLDKVIVLRPSTSNNVANDALERACEAKEDEEYGEYVTSNEDSLFTSTYNENPKKYERSAAIKNHEAINKIINSAIQTSEPSCRVGSDAIKLQLLEATVEAKKIEIKLFQEKTFEEIRIMKAEHVEKIKTMELERELKAKAFEADQRRKDEEHQLKLRILEEQMISFEKL